MPDWSGARHQAALTSLVIMAEIPSRPRQSMHTLTRKLLNEYSRCFVLATSKLAHESLLTTKGCAGVRSANGLMTRSWTGCYPEL